MQDRDWIVRNDNVWVKPNPIPDQVADRSSMSHEYVFHFVTQRFYYYNRVAVGRKTSRGTYMPPTDTWELPISTGRSRHETTFVEIPPARPRPEHHCRRRQLWARPLISKGDR